LTAGEGAISTNTNKLNDLHANAFLYCLARFSAAAVD
jgi:hypothetical protein